MVNIKDLFQKGYKYHQSGNLAAAATFYLKILDKQPDHTDTIFLIGTLHLQQGNLDAATVFLKKVIELKPNYVTAYNNLGTALQKSGKLDEAIDNYRLAMKLKPDYAEAHKNLGNALREKGKLDEAIASYRQATVLNPNDADAHNDLGATLQISGNLDKAIESHRQAIRLNPNYAMAYGNLGAALKEQGKLDEAIASHRQALSLKPDHAGTHNNLGTTLQEQGKLDEAIASYRQALSLKPDFAEAYYNLGNALKILGKIDEAIKSYEQAISLKQNYASAYVNLGTAFQGQGKSNDAISCYKKAIEIKPDYINAYFNLGNAFQDQGEFNEAISYYQKALELKPDYAEAYNNIGAIFQDLGELNEAISCYQKALELKPDSAETYSNLFHQFQQTCAWQKIEGMAARLDNFTTKALDKGTKTAETPLVSLARHTDPSRVFAVARSWSDDITRAMSTVKTHFSFDSRRSHKTKIFVGYLSNNFRNHPMAHLTLSLYGLHNRDEFKIFCYSYGEDDGSYYGTRIRQDCDKFVDIRNLSHIDSARCIYEDQIDILIDLKGYTRDSRLELSALRPAPIQVRYLGLPCTMGADFFDYIITDKIAMPEEQAQYYSENFVYMPHCYQINDRTQEISNKGWKKADFGLPEDSFVFCSFNQGYKIEPVMFNTWMNILRQIPEGVLWLQRENEITEKNLRQEVERRGVESTRLIFSGKLSKDQHLGRLGLADMALDTRIVNGIITTSDALWAGVPVITLQGSNFASRVSSSILTAIGLPELITKALEEYESLAVDLAYNPDKLQIKRQKIMKNRLVEPLFDTPRFTKNLEKAYKEMWKIFMADESPRQIEVMEN
ncbi:MAG: tetratricopeptide repeat protein [Candidatus Scalinduaceae bacterium]